MKTKTLFLSFIMTLLNFSAFAVMSNDTIASSPKSGSGIINTEYISNAKALSIARQWYGNRTDVDYYWRKRSIPTHSNGSIHSLQISLSGYRSFRCYGTAD